MWCIFTKYIAILFNNYVILFLLGITELKRILSIDKVYSEIGSRVKLSPLRRMTLPYIITNLRWLNPRSLIVLDNQEKLHLLDVRAQDNLETLDMSRVGISYASSHFKGLSTGGNVSKVCMMMR